MTGAHIHGFTSPAGTAAVVHSLAGSNPRLGIWPYPGGAEAAILNGLTYFNIHTTAFGGGEIRGQVRFGAKQPCDPDLDGDGMVGFSDLLAVITAWSPVNVKVGGPGLGSIAM